MHSYARLCELFTKNGINAISQFSGLDDFDVAWCTCAKVWMKVDRCDCIGYVMDEEGGEASNDDAIIKVRIDGVRDEVVTLPQPKYNSNDGKYEFESDDGSPPCSHFLTNQRQYVITDYWPVRMKVLLKSGNFSMTLNRVMMEYELIGNELIESNGLVLSKHVMNVKTPLDY